MTAVDRAVGTAAAVAAVAALVGLSHMPMSQEGATGGLLRLAWRARPERIERCRDQSPEALEALPPHMRQSVICEGVSASYTLEITRNGALLASVPVHPGGWRRDRPLYVFQEIAVPAGEARVGVRFTRVDAPTPPPGDNGGVQMPGTGPTAADAVRRRDELTEAVPASLSFDQPLHFAAGQVRLISYDPERRRLFEVRSR